MLILHSLQLTINGYQRDVITFLDLYKTFTNKIMHWHSSICNGMSLQVYGSKLRFVVIDRWNNLPMALCNGILNISSFYYHNLKAGSYTMACCIP
jgi:hypothetical protein